MCLILFAVRKHPNYKLILAANRDEYYKRPSEPPHFWEDVPQLLAGRDLVAGGTWLGITRKGRIAAVTNYRDPASVRPDAPSRGKLVSDFLVSHLDPASYLDLIRREKNHCNGFNLVLGDRDRITWYSNRSGKETPLIPGVYGLSNHLLDTLWPKVVRGKELLARVLQDHPVPSSESLFDLLQDRHQPPDEALPSTGVPLEWERVLSPIFIKSPEYGTRSSTLLYIDQKDHVTFMDRTFDSGSGHYETREFEFDLET